MTILRKEIYDSMCFKKSHLLKLIQSRLTIVSWLFLFQKSHKKSYEID